MADNSYITDGAIGVNVASPTSADAFNGSRPQQGTLGETHEGSDGIEWKYVCAGAALVRGSLVAISAANLATPVTATTTLMGLQLAFAQTTFAASQYGYVATRGNNLWVLISGSIATPAAVPLYTTDTAGALSTATASASQFQVWGVFMTTAVAGTTASANNGVAAFPMLRRPIA